MSTLAPIRPGIVLGRFCVVVFLFFIGGCSGCAPGRATRRRPSRSTCGRPTRRSSRRGRRTGAGTADTMEAAAHAAIAEARPGLDLRRPAAGARGRPSRRRGGPRPLRGGRLRRPGAGHPRPTGRPVAGRAGRLDREAELLAAGDHAWAWLAARCGVLGTRVPPLAAAGQRLHGLGSATSRPSRRAAGVAAGARPAAPPATMRRTAARPATESPAPPSCGTRSGAGARALAGRRTPSTSSRYSPSVENSTIKSSAGPMRCLS